MKAGPPGWNRNNKNWGFRTVPHSSTGAPRLAVAIFALCALVVPARADGLASELTTRDVIEGASGAPFETFLDHLMRAESGGHNLAANPRSTALGPYQFIKSTFIDVARRYFPDDIAGLTDDSILALRTDRGFARRAAAAYSRENHTFLTEQGLKPTFGHLRLAFLVGPAGAAKLMQVAPETQVATVLGPAVVKANPFMQGMSASDLIARATREVSDAAPRPYARSVVARPAARRRPGTAAAAVAVAVKCNVKLASCRRFVALRAKAKAPRIVESRTHGKARGNKTRSTYAGS